MGYKARVYIQGASGKQATDLGEIEVDTPPARYHHVKFKFKDGMQDGLVERIVPEDWNPQQDVTPSIYVTLSPGE